MKKKQKNRNRGTIFVIDGVSVLWIASHDRSIVPSFSSAVWLFLLNVFEDVGKVIFRMFAFEMLFVSLRIAHLALDERRRWRITPSEQSFVDPYFANDALIRQSGRWKEINWYSMTRSSGDEVNLTSSAFLGRWLVAIPVLLITLASQFLLMSSSHER